MLNNILSVAGGMLGNSGQGGNVLSGITQLFGGSNQGSSLTSIAQSFLNQGQNGGSFGFGQMSLPGLSGNANNQGSNVGITTPTPDVTNITKTGLLDNIKNTVGQNGGLGQGLKQGLGQSLKQGLGNFGASIKGGGFGSDLIQSGLSMVNQQINKDVVNSKGFNIANGVLDTAASTVGKFNPMVGLIIKGVQTGLNVANRATGKRTDTYKTDQETKAVMNSGYTGSYENMAKAESQSNLLYGGTNMKAYREAQDQIKEAKRMDETLQNINEDNQNRTLMAQNTEMNTANYSNLINGRNFLNGITVGKSGIKLDYLDRIRNLKNKHIINLDTKQIEEFKEGGVLDTIEFIPVITEPISEFKEGGKIEDDWTPIITEPVELYREGGKTEEEELVKLEETNQKNIIPEGALHKNKHHIENTEGLTQKGIPVIDNDGEQQAEIELDEIIFTLEVTKKLEELHKKYKEGNEQAATEAGKLLVQEILYNTDDRTGLIAKCEKGGKL